MFLRYSREGIEKKKKKKNMGAGIRTCSWAALPKTLHPLSTGTSSDWRTHKQNHNCEAKRNEQTSEKKYQLPQSEGTQIPNIAWKQVDKYNAILRKVEEKKADEERIK